MAAADFDGVAAVACYSYAEQAAGMAVGGPLPAPYTAFVKCATVAVVPGDASAPVPGPVVNLADPAPAGTPSAATLRLPSAIGVGAVGTQAAVACRVAPNAHGASAAGGHGSGDAVGVLTVLTCSLVRRTGADDGYASHAVQFHPHGGQSDFIWLPARTPHGAYVW